eukprot:4355172-Prymnesium_polylepis.4
MISGTSTSVVPVPPTPFTAPAAVSTTSHGAPSRLARRCGRSDALRTLQFAYGASALPLM